MVLNYIAGPLIGSLIGYCTNFIAVKMLFFPKKEIRIKGHRVPFTPGAIPKGKPRLAKAIGNIVGNTLLTREDIEAKLLSEEVAGKLADSIVDNMDSNIKLSIINLLSVSEDSYENGRAKLAEVLSEELADALSKMDLATIISEKGGAIIKEKLKGNMLGMFLNDDLIQSVIGPMGGELQNMIAEQGASYIQPVMEDKLGELDEKTSLELLDKFDISKEIIRNVIISIYMKAVKSSVGQIFDAINVQELVQTKIDEMNIDELEDLVLAVMKKELDTIVNLGAVIGLLLGILNIFI